MSDNEDVARTLAVMMEALSEPMSSPFTLLEGGGRRRRHDAGSVGSRGGGSGSSSNSCERNSNSDDDVAASLGEKGDAGKGDVYDDAADDDDLMTDSETTVDEEASRTDDEAAAEYASEDDGKEEEEEETALGEQRGDDAAAGTTGVDVDVNDAASSAVAASPSAGEGDGAREKTTTQIEVKNKEEKDGLEEEDDDDDVVDNDNEEEEDDDDDDDEATEEEGIQDDDEEEEDDDADDADEEEDDEEEEEDDDGTAGSTGSRASSRSSIVRPALSSRTVTVPLRFVGGLFAEIAVLKRTNGLLKERIEQEIERRVAAENETVRFCHEIRRIAEQHKQKQHEIDHVAADDAADDDDEPNDSGSLMEEERLLPGECAVRPSLPAEPDGGGSDAMMRQITDEVLRNMAEDERGAGTHDDDDDDDDDDDENNENNELMDIGEEAPLERRPAKRARRDAEGEEHVNIAKGDVGNRANLAGSPDHSNDADDGDEDDEATLRGDGAREDAAETCNEDGDAGRAEGGAELPISTAIRNVQDQAEIEKGVLRERILELEGEVERLHVDLDNMAGCIPPLQNSVAEAEDAANAAMALLAQKSAQLELVQQECKESLLNIGAMVDHLTSSLHEVTESQRVMATNQTQLDEIERQRSGAAFRLSWAERRLHSWQNKAADAEDQVRAAIEAAYERLNIDPSVAHQGGGSVGSFQGPAAN